MTRLDFADVGSEMYARAHQSAPLVISSGAIVSWRWSRKRSGTSTGCMKCWTRDCDSITASRPPSIISFILISTSSSSSSSSSQVSVTQWRPGGHVSASSLVHSTARASSQRYAWCKMRHGYSSGEDKKPKERKILIYCYIFAIIG